VVDSGSNKNNTNAECEPDGHLYESDFITPKINSRILSDSNMQETTAPLISH